MLHTLIWWISYGQIWNIMNWYYDIPFLTGLPMSNDNDISRFQKGFS